ncbi:MAG: response regulator [Oscillospiraceae bacterium]|nr:response regulator [Oscillospiraceae bacterium]
MFDVMIVEDDQQARDRLKTIIDWETLPVRLACEAADSNTAMELYLLHRPKILITDIRIPIISGVELAEMLKKEDPDLQIIVITGYEDFEMARRSVNVGVVDLLRKPIFKDAINSSLKKVVDHFWNKQQERYSANFLEQLIEEHLPQLQETFIANLLRKPTVDAARIEAQFQQLGIRCEGPYYAVVMLMVQLPEGISLGHETMLLQDALSANLLENGFQVYSFVDSHSRLSGIISSPTADPDNAIEEILIRTRDQVSFLIGAQVLAGIGHTVNSLSQLHESRSGALTALNYQCILGSDSIMHFKNMEQMDTVFHTQESIHAYLLQKFRENNFPAITTAVHNHITVLSAYGNPLKNIKSFLFEYVQNITNEALRLDLELYRIESYVPAILHLIQNDPAEVCAEEILHLTEQLLNALFFRRETKSSYLISMAKDYIQSNLGNERLNLEAVSDHVGLSRIYFCKLFHQVEGISFSSYLRQERIKKAKELLLTTNLKVFEVSDAVGFSNAKYFSFAFKQFTGLTPLEFKNQPRN